MRVEGQPHAPAGRLSVAVIALAFVAAACGGGSDTEVRAFSEVQAGEFTFENDPAVPGRGVFHVVTTEPMICAIVWGESEALGRFNNSLDMAGTGITEHTVVLPGAEPGATYYFRVQGSTADGTLYSSPLATFTLPADGGPTLTGTDDHGVNLALRATIAAASSEFGQGWEASNAIDGNLATEWSTRGDGDEASITIDLGGEKAVTGVEFITRTMGDGSATTATYWVVVDGGDRLGPYAAGSITQPSFQPVELRGRLVTFEVDTSTGGNTGAIEIRIFGSE